MHNRLQRELSAKMYCKFTQNTHLKALKIYTTDGTQRIELFLRTALISFKNKKLKSGQL